MRSLIQVLCTFALLLVASAARSEELPSEMKWTFQNYLKNSKHVVLVCEVQVNLTKLTKPITRWHVHVSATVVRPIKGMGAIGDRLRYYLVCEEKPPASALIPGGLSYLFLDEYTQDEFILGTGSGWNYQPELEALLGKSSTIPKLNRPPCLTRRCSERSGLVTSVAYASAAPLPVRR